MQDAVPDNLYAPPAAEIRAPVIPAVAAQPFYVVSTTKFCVLYFATFGLYGVYWFYVHWQRYRQGRTETIWPVPRAVFSIFFAHALAGRIDDQLRLGLRAYRWSPGLLATIYVVFEITGNLLSRLDSHAIGSPSTGVLGLMTLLPTGLSLMRMQAAANLACNDPAGQQNHRFTWANGVWIVLGLLLWLLVAIGLMPPA
ncbi:hypothetical protein LDO26_06000 [Luteimonas sp. BDR2-5]|uniref:hypothetical protein n=1 Tax=Proluteimonas luteida TaxID=2878685 RepID=UPI001E3C9574|nr:hypothetical protein [Luteimonas sp. BDR2-5]MCD9027754.1 hypothetical protein [Luteimonas sp. BDR2-5]